MQLVREKVYAMEQTHMTLKQKYVSSGERFPSLCLTPDAPLDTRKNSVFYDTNLPRPPAEREVLVSQPWQALRSTQDRLNSNRRRSHRVMASLVE